MISLVEVIQAILAWSILLSFAFIIKKLTEKFNSLCQECTILPIHNYITLKYRYFISRKLYQGTPKKIAGSDVF